jgi:hypothetical protein
MHQFGPARCAEEHPASRMSNIKPESDNQSYVYVA